MAIKNNFSAPATLTKRERDDTLPVNNEEERNVVTSSEVLVPGALPTSANNVSKPARALLLRLLERNPQYRLKSMRQIQQSAFYMNFNFEDVKAKKVSLKSILEQHEENDLCNLTNSLITADDFKNFDQNLCM